MDKKLYIPEPAEILSVKNLTDKEKLFEIKMVDGRKINHSPGQFVEVSLFGVGEAPISVTSSPTRNGTFELCVRAAGELTSILHQKKKGDIIGIRGPYGHGVPIEKFAGNDVLIVAGGLGLAPVRSFIQYILDNRNMFGRLIILYGTRSPSDILFERELLSMKTRSDMELHITVDIAEEWWYGNVGVITTLFPFISLNPDKTRAIIVGPPVMYKFVLKEILDRNVKEENIYMSLERRMKCGLGKCGHCQINNMYVCQCGPVFCYTEIKDKAEAI